MYLACRQFLGRQLPRDLHRLASCSYSDKRLLSESSSLRHSVLLNSRTFHLSPVLVSPRRRDFFSSNAQLQRVQQERPSQEKDEQPKRKALRKLAPKTSLRRAAIEAQRSRDGTIEKGPSAVDSESTRKDITAYCVAEQYDIARVVHILRNEGYVTDPFVTGLYPQVVHIQIEGASTDSSGQAVGDIFVFPSGTLVGWDVSESAVSTLASKTLLPAAINPHLKQLETEDLEYVEDRTKESSIIKGDTIILGTKGRSQPRNEPPQATEPERSVLDGKGEAIDIIPHDSKVDTVLAKIAFSSGLARSTKLAVLESLLSDYFESTRSIPTQLSHGSRLPFTRSFVLQKTGQLLSVRAQLNLYSELTDSLPDIFWDSRHELGLEGYYDQVGRALDIGVRIKVLNEKMDYSQEIASVLREQLSEKHSLRLEWIIIALIAVEVCFEIRREWRDADAGV